MVYSNAMNSKTVDISKNSILYSMDADLGLFNQLLQMVDGDWSDSIQGICNHIRKRFNAIAVFISVFDRSYNEFIYIVYSITKESEKLLANNDVVLTKEKVLDNIKRVFYKSKSILEYGVFTGNELVKLTKMYFNNDKKVATNIINQLDIKTVYAIPDIDADNNYTCFFHILTDRSGDEKEKFVLNEYLTQLHVALEILFLVRNLYVKATHDGLTKLFNHKQGQILLKKEMDRVERNKQPLSVVMVDIDYFKQVNDKFGHQAGNKVLEFIGSLLTKRLRRCDIISRYGGEEFLLVLPDTKIENAIEVINRLKDTIQEHSFKYSGKKFSVTASFGLVQYDTKKHVHVDSLINDVDKYLYKAKKNGRNRIEYIKSS